MSTNSLRSCLNTLENIGRTTPSPYAAGILTGSRSVVEIALGSKENDQTLLVLAARVTEISKACMMALPKEGLPTDIQAIYYVGRLLRVLDRIAKKLLAQNQRGRFTKLVLKSSDAASLKELEEQLEQCAAMLSLHLQMDNLRLSDTINAWTHLQESEVRKAIAKGQKEEMDLIQSHFFNMKRSNQDISKRLLPPSPHIFHGRSKDIHQTVPTLLKDAASYLCILGTGGVGKTSFGLAVLHHPDIIECYHSYRYFIPCDALTDTSALLTAIASLFEIAEKSFWTRFTELCRALGKKILLMLDNFESPWESSASRKDVEMFLGKLASIPYLSIIITLRGAERPYGVPWTRPFMQPLTTLDLNSAVQTFVDISDVSETSVGLEELLIAVDMLPLAVTLLASQAQCMSCSELLVLWKSQKTSMVTRGMNDRFSNLDVSIQISLSSSRLLQCPEALILLQILSVLPDGADETGLKVLAPGNFDTAAMITVIRVGLAHRNEAGRLRSLSPVREHLQIFQPMGPDLFRRIFSFHNSLALYAHDTWYKGEDCSLMIKTISPQIGNLHSVLALGFERVGFEKSAAVAVASVHAFHKSVMSGPNRPLLDSALKTARLLGDPVLEADCLMASRWFDPLHHSKVYMENVLAVYRRTGDKFRLSICLVAIAGIYLHTDSVRVADAIMEIIDKLQPDIPSMVAASAYSTITQQYCSDGNLKAARRLIRKAFTVPGLNRRATALLLSANSTIYAHCGQFSASLKCAIQSAECEVVSIQASSRLYFTIEAVYFTQSRLSLSAKALEDGTSLTGDAQSSNSHGPYSAARLAILTGDFPMALSKCRLLQIMGLKAEGQSYTNQGSVLRRLLACALAEMEMFSNNLSAASTHLESAHYLERRLDWVSKYSQVETLLRQADLLTMMGLLLQALNPSILALILCSRFGDPLGLSMALQRIGDIFYAEEVETSHAKACFTAELNIIQDPILDMGVNRHAGDCLLRLGMVALKNRIMDEAKTMFEQARGFYITSEDDSGIKYCELRLAELHVLEGTDSTDPPPLPIGNRLILTG